MYASYIRPDPEAEVIALSPKTLMATNRFVCEICGKGFQRDQNLQLHRRGHNLPWKLRQRSGKEPRKRVYVCPEKTCIHHNPARALGDLTGIKKHFCRKHGEKKWKCDKCSKRYAVQSDWKAHSKTCGTREYRCDCGTLFSRRDSFITHRAFCDALAEETARVSAAFGNMSNSITSNTLQQFPSQIKPGIVNGEVDQQAKQQLGLWILEKNASFSDMHQIGQDLFNSCSTTQQLGTQLSWAYGDKFSSSTSTVKEAGVSQLPLFGSLPALFSAQQHQPTPTVVDTSATALLQKAAQIGVTSSAMPFMGSFESPRAQTANPSDRFEELFNAKNQASNLENVLSNFGVLKDDVGGETRDFLGVGMHSLSQPSINGWI
ncbi:zinc finger protein NUTCRACKER-like [Canna indica]|uniref:Protein EARLY HEADING DATE 2 n=1 Tax=Canna indica TaxID=4628 RepID=A0AAQ3KH69_9LILI|nr:zinc finger protein NUTCRACKER-like [Canna indica]